MKTHIVVSLLLVACVGCAGGPVAPTASLAMASSVRAQSAEPQIPSAVSDVPTLELMPQPEPPLAPAPAQLVAVADPAPLLTSIASTLPLIPPPNMINCPNAACTPVTLWVVAPPAVPSLKPCGDVPCLPAQIFPIATPGPCGATPCQSR